MSPSRRVDPNPSGSVPVTGGAHSRRDPGATGQAPGVPRHLKSRGSRHRRELRRGRVFAVTAVAAAALIGVIGYLATSSSPRTCASQGAGASHHPHTSSPVTLSRPPTTRPAVSSTTTAPTTTRPAVSTTTSSPPPTSTSTNTVAATPPAATVPPSDVLVEVLNGVGTPKAASQVAHALHRIGFAINGTGNAASFDHTRNLIEYGPDSLAAAETVAAHVSGVAQYREYSALQRNEVWIILGATYDGVTS